MNDKVRLLRKDSVVPDAGGACPGVARVTAVENGAPVVRTGAGTVAVTRMSQEVRDALAGGIVGRDVLLLFENGDPELPIAVAVLYSPEADRSGAAVECTPNEISAQVDGEEYVVTAKKRIRLQCGKGSITITRDGKIILRGTNLLSRSSGPLRIKGGHVEIN